jgi:putative transposase
VLEKRPMVAFLIPLLLAIRSRFSRRARLEAENLVLRAIFSGELDASLTRLGLKVITTPVHSPQANSLCERLIETLRRECLDWIIALSEGHLSKVLASWMAHYNRGRPHSSLGPGIPDPRSGDLRVKPCGHRLPVGHRVVATPILGGLHHEYSLQRLAA